MTHPHFSTQKSTVQQEGTTYKNKFGAGLISDFERLAFVEYETGPGFEVYILYLYRITKDHYIQWIDLFIDDDNDVEKTLLQAGSVSHNIVCQYQYDWDLTFKENLLTLFAEFIHARSMFDGHIIQFSSDLISDEDYQSILANIEDRKKNPVHSKLLDFMKNNGLQPYAHDAKKGLYLSRCVNTANHHLYISISAEKEEWGCGYCKRKGGINELKQWINEKKSL